MALYGLCLVKDEADIIEQCLRHGLDHCERIYVLDNGSTDGTWERVNSMAEQTGRVIPVERTTVPYRDGLRSLVYNAYHRELSADDWWLYLDADEFLADDPEPAIEAARRERADLILAWQIQFQFTDVDYRKWLEHGDDRGRHIFERRRYYRINWREPRLFRNDPERPWDEAVCNTVPHWARRRARRALLNRHYQYRDPAQIRDRIERRKAYAQFGHVPQGSWQAAICPASRCVYHRQGERWRRQLSGTSYFYARRLLRRVERALPFAFR